MGRQLYACPDNGVFVDRKVRQLEARIDALTKALRLLVSASHVADDAARRQVEQILRDAEAGTRVIHG